MIKVIAPFSALLLWAATAWGQPLTLERCYEAARARSPLQAQAALDASAARLLDENFAARWLPQLSLAGQATYQSDAVSIPAFMPGMEPIEAPQFQYRLGLDAQQTLYDGGAVRYARALNLLTPQVNEAQRDVELRKLNETVNSLFFGVLLMERQAAILQEAQADLRQRRGALESAVRNGILLRSDLLLLDKQLLQLEQQQIQAASELVGLRRMLAAWTGLPEAESAALAMPAALPAVEPAPVYRRPEYRLIDLQLRQLDLRAQSLRVQQMPKAGLFLQAGAGQPNPYNFLNTNLSAYYLVGLRVSWAPWDWRVTARERELLGVQQRQAEIRREQLDQTLLAGRQRDLSLLGGIDSVLGRDDAIIRLQSEVVKLASAQVENGVRTVSDYTKEFQAMVQAQLQREVHVIQRMQAAVQLRTMEE
ncbi:MAG: TolC family protein [Bacteroidia bacterium]|nr:TolC family protein [Bacteroidia bacterium]